MSLSRTGFLGRLVIAVLLFAPGMPRGAEFHVAPGGSDTQPGTAAAPFRTIQRAAEAAQPGDVITVHAGIYREYVRPPRGGLSDDRRITYQAAPGEKVEIRGSEVIRGWERVRGGVWRVTLPNSFFGGFNPYRDAIRGDWFDPRGRQHHTGAVYLDGEWLTEAATLGEVLDGADGPTSAALWFARVEAATTTLWAQFPGVNPNERQVEINVRQAVFYPSEPGRDYLTVRGFALRHAATPWAPPTAEQMGLIGTHWSRGWIIESNVISHSVCVGVALGKYGDAWDNTSANTAEGYVKTIDRALANGWDRATIGHHLVRQNHISHCEQAGIVGSLGAAFSVVTGNRIHDIHVRRLFSGAEMAGIKFHAAIDTVIQGNHIYRTCRGLWLDWMAQGTRVSGNCFHDNAGEDVFMEVDHGPFVIDNNLFLSPVSLLDMSEGGAYVHNLFAGKLISRPEPSRETPYHPAHTTMVAGLATIRGGDNRFFNNLFVGRGTAAGAAEDVTAKDPQWGGGYGLWVYGFRDLPTLAEGNVFYNGALPLGGEAGASVTTERNPGVNLEDRDGHLDLRLEVGRELDEPVTRLVTTDTLGKAVVPGLPYENADGTALRIDRDYFGNARNPARPTPGPFERPASPGSGAMTLRVW